MEKCEDERILERGGSSDRHLRDLARPLMTSGLAEDTRKGLLPSYHTFVQPQLHETMCVFMFDCVHHMGIKMSLTLLPVLNSYLHLHPTLLSLPPNFWRALLLVRVRIPVPISQCSPWNFLGQLHR